MQLIEGGMGEQCCGLLNGSSAGRGCWGGGSPRRPWRLVCGVAIEIVVEDGADRAVGQRADLEARVAAASSRATPNGLDQPQDAEAGAEALLGMRPLAQDESRTAPRSRGRSRRPRRGCARRPIGVAPVARRHVLAHVVCLRFAARPHVRGDALAAGGTPRRCGR